MRTQPEQGQRQLPVPVSTSRALTSSLSRGNAAVVFGSAGSVVALVDAGCSVTHIESDPGRAFGAEFLLDAKQRTRLRSVVIDRGDADGRQEYARAFQQHGDGAALVVVGGRSRNKIVESVCQHAAPGTQVVVIRGGRDKYKELVRQVAASGRRVRLESGPAADGSSVRTSAVIIEV